MRLRFLTALLAGALALLAFATSSASSAPAPLRFDLQPRLVADGSLRARVMVAPLDQPRRLEVALLDSYGSLLRRLPPVSLKERSDEQPQSSIVRVLVKGAALHSLPTGVLKVRVRLLSPTGQGFGGEATSKTLVLEGPRRARVVSRFAGVGRRVALTFDDCSDGQAWSSILRTLARAHLEASFFCPGQMVRSHPALAHATVAAGDVVGSHGWDHAVFSGLGFTSSLHRLVWDRDVWRRWGATATPYFRPPYGSYSDLTVAAAGRAGYSWVVMWDVDPRDWSRPGSATIASRVLSAVRPGSIVLMHVLPQTAAALPAILAGLARMHLHPLSLDQLLHVPGARPSRGSWPVHGR